MTGQEIPTIMLHKKPTDWSDGRKPKGQSEMISKFSVKKPYTVLVGVVLVIVLGVVSFTRMTADLLPSINLPYVVIMTTYVGASPETVEMAVTKPIESSMATVSNIENISSVSSENYSMVVLEFTQTADMNAITLEIRENLDQLKSYWDDSVGNPIMMKLNPDMLPVMIAAVGVEGMNNAQVSEYVQNQIIPEIESLEGVASASASGLIDESINVVIRQDKIDAINRQIYASIDEAMKEQEEKLSEGRDEIAKNQKELNDAQKKITDGKAELTENEDKLTSGKTELDNKKTATSAQLAEAEKQLLTAKADLEAAKISITTQIATIKQLQDGYKQAAAGVAKLEEAMTQLETLKAGIGALSTIEEANLFLQSPELPEEIRQMIQGAIAAGEAMGADWDTIKAGIIGTLDKQLEELSVTLEGAGKKLQDLADALNANTNTLGAEAFIAALNTQLSEINTQIATVDQGLLELSQGRLTASIEFSNANTQLELGEYQINAAKTQLEASESQLESGKEQLQDALEQIVDGEEQLAEAKEDAYDSADMTEVLTVDTVKSLLTAQNFSMPAGYVHEDGLDYMIRIGDKPEDLEELKKLPLLNLHMDGVDIITLEAVADVFYTDNSAEVYTNINGTPGVMLTIQKQTGYSTGDVSKKLADRFERLMGENPDLTLTALMDQGIYIDLVMDAIVGNVLWGALLAILILVLFLKDVKPTVVIACSIPISLVTAVVCMYFSGVTLNIISLSGLALGIGMLVDNSIVVIENIYRLRSEGVGIKEAAVEGAKEVSGAIVASTLTTVCVFAPIVFTEGITRQLFVDMGLTIAYSLLASLLIALTVVPAMSSKLLDKTKNPKDSRFFSAMTAGYEKVLALCLKMKPAVLLVVILLLGISFAAAMSRGTAFMPSMDSTQLSVNVQLEEDATIEDVRVVTDTLVERIMEIEDVADVGAMTGGSSMGMLMGGGSQGPVNAASVYVTTKEEKTLSNEEIASLIMERSEDLGAEITVDTSNMDMSALGGSGISIQVRGRDLDKIQEIANEIAAIVEGVEGTAEVSDGMEETTEELRIIVDKQKAMEYGLTVAQIFTQIQPKLAESQSAASLEEAAKDYGIYVINGNDAALTRELIRELTVEGTGEEQETVDVPLSEIVTFENTEGLSSIQRDEQTRYVEVSASIADGYNVGLVSGVLNERLADYELPEGYSLVFSGENETINDAMEQLVLMLVLALVFMYLIMVAQFQSLLHPFIIMFTIPLAFTGGLLGLFFTGSEVSVIAMIGFVMLSGIIVNNGIVLIDYINQLRLAGMEKREAILTAGRTRLRPVLMTALTTILAMSTMVFSNDMGSEMAKPMATVTIGGLLYGTLLTLLVIPCVYDLLTRKKVKKFSKSNNGK